MERLKKGNMKVVIPSNEKETLAPRSGRAKWFMIFNISDNKIVSTELKENNHEHHHHEGHTHSHEHGHSHADMVEQLKGCELMITQKVGPHFGQELQDANIRITITKENLISEVLKSYIS